MRRVPLVLISCAALALPVFAVAQDSDPTPAKAVQLIEQVNARLEAGGSPLRLTEAWFFTIGRGVDLGRILGVSRFLIRLSVGLEDPEQLLTRIEQALTL